MTQSMWARANMPPCLPDQERTLRTIVQRGQRKKQRVTRYSWLWDTRTSWIFGIREYFPAEYESTSNSASKSKIWYYQATNFKAFETHRKMGYYIRCNTLLLHNSVLLFIRKFWSILEDSILFSLVPFSAPADLTLFPFKLSGAAQCMYQFVRRNDQHK